jgi:hypothetical protein
MFNKTLPIGTVVLIKGATKRVMVIGYHAYNGTDTTKIYDYMGCLFPEGYINPETTILFNQDSIDTVINLGYRNDIQQSFQFQLTEALKEEEQQTKSDEQTEEKVQ